MYLFTVLVCFLTIILRANFANAENVVVVQKFYAGSGDGYCMREDYNTNSPTNWDYSHDNTQSTSTDYTSDESHVWSQWYNVSTKWGIGRSFLPIDTSDIPTGAMIISAKLQIYTWYIYDLDNDGEDWITIVQTTQANTTSLSNDDFDQCGSVNNPTEGGLRVDISNMGTDRYQAFILNDTGISWINAEGITKLGLREGHDALDHPITANSSSYANILYWSTSETAGTSQDPYLEITYVCDVNNVPTNNIVSVMPYFSADFNNDNNVDVNDITDFINSQKEILNFWIKNIWQNELN
ncbi:TPA: hypothetical protein DDY55_04670 [Candidatus Falkowbacteria bacterium]|nr:hypothetical protein [Candidatus Falkowbacteria bacterium]